MGTEIVGGTRRDDGSVEKQRCVRTDAKRFFDVVVGEHDGHTRAGKGCEQIPELGGLCRIDAGERLVADDHTRRAREDSPELEASSFTPGQETGTGPRVVFEKHLREDRVDALRVGLSVSDRDERLHVLFDREVPKHAWALGHVSEAAACAEVKGIGRHVVSVERHAALMVALFPNQHSKKRGFSRA